jgi:hypothetical protein
MQGILTQTLFAEHKICIINPTIYRYKKSVARYKDLIFTSGKISEFTPKDVVIFTRAIAIEDKCVIFNNSF